MASKQKLGLRLKQSLSTINEDLPRLKEKSKKRVGRGLGSGKGGHTSGRGQKGQKTRGKIGPLFEGTKIKKSLIKRLPLQRGKGKHSPGKGKIVVNVKYLELLPGGSVVDVLSLTKAGIVGASAKGLGIKILGEGKLTRALTVRLPVSKGAAEKIKKAGGAVENEATH
ncbi:MAG: 50S ribosomal protein L15 [bacterium]|nr:50S ribosomal protein L15 [bacterium]